MSADGIDWVDVGRGSATMGSDVRSILFGAPGPQHEVSIDYGFSISRLPVDAATAARMVESGDASIASEGEWELAMAAGSLSGDGMIEALADRTAHSYWGKPCDGRPFIAPRATVVLARDWSGGVPLPRAIEVADAASAPKRLVRRPTAAHVGDPPTLPGGPDRARLVREEAMIWSIVGVLPSFIWAWFNASSGYIADGWLNLVLGGCFIGVASVVLWRPRTPSYRVSNDGTRMERAPRSRV